MTCTVTADWPRAFADAAAAHEDVLAIRDEAVASEAATMKGSAALSLGRMDADPDLELPNARRRSSRRFANDGTDGTVW
jgi:hypothetical protein